MSANSASMTCAGNTCTGFLTGPGPWTIDVGSGASSVSWSGPGTASHTPGSDTVTITLGAGASDASNDFFTISFTPTSSTGGDPHVKPLDGDDYTL